MTFLPNKKVELRTTIVLALLVVQFLFVAFSTKEESIFGLTIFVLLAIIYGAVQSSIHQMIWSAITTLGISVLSLFPELQHTFDKK